VESVVGGVGYGDASALLPGSEVRGQKGCELLG